jgi:hypothetical protein
LIELLILGQNFIALPPTLEIGQRNACQVSRGKKEEGRTKSERCFVRHSSASSGDQTTNFNFEEEALSMISFEAMEPWMSLYRSRTSASSLL